MFPFGLWLVWKMWQYAPWLMIYASSPFSRTALTLSITKATCWPVSTTSYMSGEQYYINELIRTKPQKWKDCHRKQQLITNRIPTSNLPTNNYLSYCQKSLQNTELPATPVTTALICYNCNTELSWLLYKLVDRITSFSSPIKLLLSYAFQMCDMISAT